MKLKYNFINDIEVQIRLQNFQNENYFINYEGKISIRVMKLQLIKYNYIKYEAEQKTKVK